MLVHGPCLNYLVLCTTSQLYDVKALWRRVCRHSVCANSSFHANLVSAHEPSGHLAWFACKQSVIVYTFGGNNAKKKSPLSPHYRRRGSGGDREGGAALNKMRSQRHLFFSFLASYFRKRDIPDRRRWKSCAALLLLREISSSEIALMN